ncbi:hypothetical protein P5P86_17555 [Nocardioides sp. BP30]|uniref:hypothetical protein n=1 Tax=Nocardioides sp. BP30 TaxID=3036374 RepID=UPI00246872C7|nr:hypothetical protein [Nocardioides sp. BP30]WGL51752.1 hypothetical protein P5P86_17555 [Nocardioides sp. BP30]
MSDETRSLPAEPEQPERTELLEEAVDPEPGERPRHDEGQRRTGSHPINVGHLVMGLVFLAIVGGWALVQSDTVTGTDIRWLLPLPWVIGGGVGLIAVAISGLRRHGVGR